MLFTWNEQTIDWFLDASAYTGFHHKLAQRLRLYLEPEDSICDIGCGLGRLSLELAPYVMRLTAIDINESVISRLRSDAVLLGRKNLYAKCGDAAQLEESFDVILASFFGQSPAADTLVKHCRRKLLYIVSAENKSGLYPGRHRRAIKCTASTLQEKLIKTDLVFKAEEAVLEFGQPLRSWQDAVKYIRHNAPEADAHEIDTFLHEHITQTGRPEFPFYLPNPKKLGIFIIDMEGNA